MWFIFDRNKPGGIEIYRGNTITFNPDVRADEFVYPGSRWEEVSSSQPTESL